MIKSPIVTRINKILIEKDISANRVATLAGLRQSSLSDILNGRTISPKLDTLEAIAKGLNMSLTELLNFPPYNERPDGTSPVEEQSKWDMLGEALTSDEKERVRKILTNEKE